MKKLHMAAIALLLLALNGCAASVYPFTFDSNPQGATVICSDRTIGYTPVTMLFDKEKMRNSNEAFDTRVCSANWASTM